jgi:hypothetical protein
MPRQKVSPSLESVIEGLVRFPAARAASVVKRE